MMNKSETIAELAKALAKAQGEIENATKNQQNPHFKSGYADLAAVLGEIRAAFAPNGLSIVQMPFNCDNGDVGIETMLMHASGEWVSSQVSCKANKPDAPSLGSVLTYLRRYSASAFAGIAQEDDDGGAPGKALSPAIDATAQKWIDAVKLNPAVLNQIQDAAYKKFIKEQAGVK